VVKNLEGGGRVLFQDTIPTFFFWKIAYIFSYDSQQSGRDSYQVRLEHKSILVCLVRCHGFDL